MRPDLLLVKDYVSSLSMPKRHTVPPSGAASPPPRGKANRFRPPHTAWGLAPQPGGFFDESFVQLFTWSYFVSVCLDSGLRLLCQQGFRCLVEPNYPQRLRAARLTSVYSRYRFVRDGRCAGERHLDSGIP